MLKEAHDKFSNSASVFTFIRWYHKALFVILKKYI